MFGIRASTLASAVSRRASTLADDDGGATPDELRIVPTDEQGSPKSRAPQTSKKWNLIPIRHTSSKTDLLERRQRDANKPRPRRRRPANTTTLDESFPAYDEVLLLPPEIQRTLRDLVLDYFRRKLYPRLVYLVHRKHRRAAVASALSHGNVPMVSMAFIVSQTSIFARWPGCEHMLRTSLSLRIVERGELLTHEGDTTHEGIYFMVQGTLHGRVRRRPSEMQPTFSGAPPGIVRGLDGRPVSRKSLSDNNTLLRGVYDSPLCYGEMTPLTEEPRPESLRATTRCLVWVLPRSAFFRHLEALAPVPRSTITEAAYEQRCANIRTVFPLTGAALRTVDLFSHVPLDRLDALAPRAEPRVYREGTTIADVGDTALEMLYIVRGVVGVFSATPTVSSGCDATAAGLSTPLTDVDLTSNDGSEGFTAAESERRSGPGTIVGETSVLFAQKRNNRLIALTTVDAYAITRDAITQSISHQGLMTRVLEKAHAIQAQRQKHAKGRFIEYIAHIPILEHLTAPEGFLAAMLELFTNRVYAPRVSIVSVSGVADRLLICTRGRARITSANRDFGIGECIGYTCLVPHRWQYHAVAVDTVETIELSYVAFSKLLKSYGLHEEMLALTHGLLYPKVYPTEFKRAWAMIRHLPGPPSYPSSAAYEVRPFAARVAPLPAILQHRQTTTTKKSQQKSPSGVCVFAERPMGAANYTSSIPFLSRELSMRDLLMGDMDDTDASIADGESSFSRHRSFLQGTNEGGGRSPTTTMGASRLRRSTVSPSKASLPTHSTDDPSQLSAAESSLVHRRPTVSEQIESLRKKLRLLQQQQPPYTKAKTVTGGELLRRRGVKLAPMQNRLIASKDSSSGGHKQSSSSIMGGSVAVPGPRDSLGGHEPRRYEHRAAQTTQSHVMEMYKRKRLGVVDPHVTAERLRDNCGYESASPGRRTPLLHLAYAAAATTAPGNPYYPYLASAVTSSSS